MRRAVIEESRNNSSNLRGSSGSGDAPPPVKPASFATLLNRKLAAVIDDRDFVALDRFFFQSVMRDYVGRIRLDERWYLGAYKDVGRAIDDGLVAGARDHYLRFGYYEHRLPYRIAVKEAWYVETYADVREAIARRAFATGQAHFEANGYREGRLPYPGFELALE